MKPLDFLSPDGAPTAAASADSPSPTAPDKAPKPRGAFNREVAAQLSEAVDLIVTARDPRFSAMLGSYGITPAQIDALEVKITLASQKFGVANSGAQSGQAGTARKEALEDDLEDAIRPVQTGARLTFMSSAADQRRYFIGARLDEGEAQLELIASTILQNLQTDTLRGVTPATLQTLQNAYTAWHDAVLAQSSSQNAPQEDRAQGEALLKEITPLVREIKIAGDGAYTYKNPVNRPIRKFFHIPENRPYTYTPQD